MLGGCWLKSPAWTYLGSQVVLFCYGEYLNSAYLVKEQDRGGRKELG